jgi:predicted nucleic acid-binding Zn ribbon protein
MAYGQPQRIGDILAQLMARRGYAREQSGQKCVDAWRDAAGPALAACSRATQVRRGVLEVLVNNSTMLQEIGYRKQELLKRLAAALPEEGIRDLKLRLGPVAGASSTAVEPRN